MNETRRGESNPASWLVSVKTVVSMIAAIFTIFSMMIGAAAWCIGLYSGLSNRVTVLEQSNQAMRDDVKDIKGLVSQLVLSTAGNRPDTKRWAK